MVDIDVGSLDKINKNQRMLRGQKILTITDLFPIQIKQENISYEKKKNSLVIIVILAIAEESPLS